MTETLRQLVEQGFLTENENGYIKSLNKIRLALNQPHEGIRKFHTEMIEKAKTLLKTEEGWQNREITGLTIAGNPENFERARLKLIEAFHEAANILSDGPSPQKEERGEVVFL